MRVDAAELEIFKNLFHSVAEEMGAALRRSAFSPNIKERRDYSCAVFDGSGRVVAMGDHMPVHLGSMPMSVAAAIRALELGVGDIVMLNDPYAGGTHLPDITLVMPVFSGRVQGFPGVRPQHTNAREPAPTARVTPSAAAHNRPLDSVARRTVPAIERHFAAHPVFYVANRAHHADIGGGQPASMGLSEEIYQEGLRIPPVKLARSGKIERDVMAVLLSNVRTPLEREGDLMAQVAACRLGERRLAELLGKYGVPKTTFHLEALQRYSARLMRQALAQIPDGTYRAQDYLDDDGYGRGPVRLRVVIRIRGEKAIVDFRGSSPACRGGVNAVFAITSSAVFYVFRCLLGEDVPACAGLMAPIEVRAPEGSVLNARPPAAVAAGNVETSQRIVDVLLRALAGALPERIPAASSGTMNNVSFGGFAARPAAVAARRDPLKGGTVRSPRSYPLQKQAFAYYETIAGGMGARPTADGLSGVHTHMTNSLNTPVEALECAYPVRVQRYSLRRGSGGSGRYRGGDGIIREIEFLTSVRGSILSDRRRFPPYGLAGGKPGRRGRNLLQLGGSVVTLPSKTAFDAPRGSILRIETPGGGGWGRRKVKGRKSKI